MPADSNPRDHLSAGSLGYAVEPYDASQHHSDADAWWRDCASRAIDHLAGTGQPFTAADLGELGVPDPDHPNRIGALFSAARNAGTIRPVGYTTSPTKSRHGGVVRVWKGTQTEGVAKGERRD